MKIILTGSLGHISAPLTKELVQKGHAVTVISSKAEKQSEIETLGAAAAIGSLEDVEFLKATFTGADAVYTMVPPANYFDHSLDLLAYYRRLGSNYAAAIKQAGVKHVVNLSTIGAHLEKGSGILTGAHDVEGIINELPADVSITHIRPTSFYYNLFAYAHTIKTENRIVTNYGAGDIIPWVSPADIAAAVAEEIVATGNGRKIRYVASEELTGAESASILGEAMGKPDLRWDLISSEEALDALLKTGMNPRIAAGLVEMFGSLHTGLLSEDYFRNRPAVMGEVKLADYAKEFAAAMNNQQ
ncbi:NmrA family NAD(P)-binding protein [Mucilaginibacter gilvus]|uniref:NAD-dependent dehydratase n=1 Tax=Mucilaginibacter gilvus TaxID=2305909 RepID=A0A3S3UVN0_9SPHI|nr:NAD(P)H-binding protein [Mucilaginibacter gilvus]RWY55552.1 NAD-dependent dehydratase [Mucilaginibacter gilvus]